LAHYAHQTHLTAEALEFGGHLAHLQRHADSARKLLKTHGQMAYDLRRMNRTILKLQNVAKQGGRAGGKGTAALAKARQAYHAAQAAFENERKAALTAQKFIQEGKAAQAALKGTAALKSIALAKVAEAAVKLESVLRTSAVGSKLLSIGRITASKPVVRGLIVVGAAMEAVESYTDSTATTTAGKTANALLGAGGGALVMGNPLVAGADLLAPEDYKPSKLYHGTAAALSSIGEGLVTNDSKAMDDFHKRSMAGSYGKVLQAASEAGEFWAYKGISRGLGEFADAVKWWAGL
jgi:hypothetical protein